MKEFKPTWLYIKQHNITGLKYFGKTVQDPLKYKGSGIHWTSHLNKHGNNVTTVWHHYFSNKQELTEYATKFSIDNNIVDSKEWANIKIEDGLMGGDTGISDEGRRILSEKSGSRKHSEETKQKIREARANQPNPRLGKKHSKESIKKIKAARALQKNIKGITRE
jgi:adenine specific DNA methylase Mod